MPCRASVSSSQAQQSQEQLDARAPLAGNGELVLFNTMSRTKERMQPRNDGDNKLSMYCCGVTVYDLSHIGNIILTL